MAKLVAIGDSLTQGFQSLAISRTDLSYPQMIAEAMGLDAAAFVSPDFSGSGGLPLSIEWLARRLCTMYGANIDAFEWAHSLATIPSLIDEVETYWERGDGSRPVADVLHHNLAVWGFEVGDSYGVTAAACKQAFGAPKNNWFAPPSRPRERTAYRVLNPAHAPSREADTQLSIAKAIKTRDGNIEHLIAALGPNNCLGTVVDLQIRETGSSPPGPFSKFTLWTRSAFELEYLQLASELAAIGADHVYVATVPHVTIPPITRGIMLDGSKLPPPGEKYFDHYARFFMRDEDFNPDSDEKLTKKEAKYIDDRIDEYNEIIVGVAKARGWIVIDWCEMLDLLAVRRNQNAPKYPMPPALADLDIRLFQADRSGRILSGGLMSLDGVHPTACGYALMAQEAIYAMRRFMPSLPDIDFAAIRARDPLVSNPPRTLYDTYEMLHFLEAHFHLSRWMLSRGE